MPTRTRTETREALQPLPDHLTLQLDPADGWTGIVYDEHLIGIWDPPEARSMCRLHLLEGRHNRLDVDPDKFAGYLKILTLAGFRFSDILTAPHSAGRSLRVLLYEGWDVEPKKLQNAIWWTYRLSRRAIDPREL